MCSAATVFVFHFDEVQHLVASEAALGLPVIPTSCLLLLLPRHWSVQHCGNAALSSMLELMLHANTASGFGLCSSPRRLTRVSDDDVFEEVRVRHGPWFLCGQLSLPLHFVRMKREYVLSVDDSPFSPVGAEKEQ